MFVGNGIIKDLFGLGVGQGDFSWTTDADATAFGDYVGRNISFAKANGGDPDFSVYAYGQKYIAARKLTVGAGVTVLGRGNPSGGTIVDAPGETLGSGAAGGLGSVGDTVGTAGDNSGPARGGNGGSGGTSGTRAGGAGGLASVTDLKNGWREMSALTSGHVINAGTIKLINGGSGGGGGGGSADGNGGDGGGGGGVIIMAAPVIEIAGIIDMRGHVGTNGNAGSGTTNAGGGGGGGGGLLILIYGELILTGSILIDGGEGGDGFGGGSAGGSGGLGGRLWKYNGNPEDFTETVGATGATGAAG